MAFGFKKKKTEASDKPIALDNAATNVAAANRKLDETRKNMVALYNVLEGIDFAKIAARNAELIPAPMLDQYRFDVSAAKFKLENETAAGLALVDSEKIDGELLYFAEHFRDALASGRVEAANANFDGLKYGITKGHEPILGTERDQTDRIVDNRVQHIRIYKNITECYSKIDELGNAIIKQERMLDEAVQEYERSKDELKEASVRRPDLVEKIDQLGVDAGEMNDPEIHKLSRMMMSTHQKSQSIRLLRSQIERTRSLMQAQREAVNVHKINLTTMSSSNDEEMREKLEEASTQILKTLHDMDENYLKYVEAFNKISAGLRAVNSNPEIAEAMVGAKLAIEKDTYEEEAARMAEEEGRKRYAEYLDAEAKRIEEELAADQKIENSQQNLQQHKQLLSN